MPVTGEVSKASLQMLGNSSGAGGPVLCKWHTCCGAVTRALWLQVLVFPACQLMSVASQAVRWLYTRCEWPWSLRRPYLLQHGYCVLVWPCALTHTVECLHTHTRTRAHACTHAFPNACMQAQSGNQVSYMGAGACRCTCTCCGAMHCQAQWRTLGSPSHVLNLVHRQSCSYLMTPPTSRNGK